jgi:hypothetical protein
MLVTFSSKAGADILMLGEHAKPLLALTGKNIETNIPVRGIFTPAELPQAIARLEQAIANETPQKNEDEDDEGPRNAISLPVGLRQRAFPLLDLMRKASQKNQDIMWEAGSGW